MSYQRNPPQNAPQPHRPGTHPMKRGKILALTFGTLLSSQGADAHHQQPFGHLRGNPFKLSWSVSLCQTRLGPTAPPILAPNLRGDPRCSVREPGVGHLCRLPAVPVSRSPRAGRKLRLPAWSVKSGVSRPVHPLDQRSWRLHRPLLSGQPCRHGPDGPPPTVAGSRHETPTH